MREGDEMTPEERACWLLLPWNETYRFTTVENWQVWASTFGVHVGLAPKIAAAIRAAVQEAEARMRKPLPPEICPHGHPTPCKQKGPDVDDAATGKFKYGTVWCSACEDMSKARDRATEGYSAEILAHLEKPWPNQATSTEDEFYRDGHCDALREAIALGIALKETK